MIGTRMIDCPKKVAALALEHWVTIEDCDECDYNRSIEERRKYTCSWRKAEG